MSGLRKGLTGVGRTLYFLVARVGGFLAEVAILVGLVTSGHPVGAIAFFFIGTPFLLTIMHLLGLLVALPFAALGDSYPQTSSTLISTPSPAAVPRQDLAFGQAQAGKYLALGTGIMWGILKNERFAVTVEARETKLLVVGEAFRSFAYPSIASFRIAKALPESFAAKALSLQRSEDVIHLSVTEGGSEGRWRLLIRPDDSDKWRHILDEFGIEDIVPDRDNATRRPDPPK